MRSIKKRLSLRHLVIVIGAVAIAMPIAARVSPTSSGVVIEQQAYLAQPIASDDGDTNAKDDKAAVRGVERLQDDYYYERRRRYWEDRVERDLDEEENGDDEDAKDSKDSKAKDDEDKADSKEDSEEVERRRDYWRDRLDREW